MLDQYPREYLTPQEVAREIGSDDETVRFMLRTGTMPGKKIGCRWYVAKEWLSTPSNQGKDYAQPKETADQTQI